MSRRKDSDEITPEKAIAILAKHGTHITIDEAAKVLDFMRMLAELNLDQFEKDARKKSSVDTNKKERPL
jgi:hypothetical protein